FSGPEYEPIKATGENTHDLSKLLDTSGRFSKAYPNKCGSGSSISGDGDCKVAIQCNGDAIQCAIVRQEKAARCADEEFRTVDDKKIQDLKNTLAGEFSGPEYEPIKATGENTHDLSKLLDTSGRFSKA
ncbi:hypothetical protein ACXKGW_29585, partial [Klebsiella pneumoniae subsp. pneumoniae]